MKKCFSERSHVSSPTSCSDRSRRSSAADARACAAWISCAGEGRAHRLPWCLAYLCATLRREGPHSWRGFGEMEVEQSRQVPRSQGLPTLKPKPPQPALPPAACPAPAHARQARPPPALPAQRLSPAQTRSAGRTSPPPAPPPAPSQPALPPLPRQPCCGWVVGVRPQGRGWVWPRRHGFQSPRRRRRQRGRGAPPAPCGAGTRGSRSGTCLRAVGPPRRRGCMGDAWSTVCSMACCSLVAAHLQGRRGTGAGETGEGGGWWGMR